MWLLSTSRAELQYFDSPETVPGGYAILSHVWQSDVAEDTFQDLRKLYARCSEASSCPRDYVSSKTRQCCILAEQEGYQYAWNDTCCIDKSNDVELSESINSMFRYYAQAEICFAYLYDVPSGDVQNDSVCRHRFRISRWHERGWTLQELLAPESLVFFSQDWEVLGTKCDLAELLEEVTQIPREVLRHEQEITEMSVAQRLSWAATRRTTKVEDEAYCLMGILGINMPTLYGEGSNAFRRLQEEIMRQSTDMSLFAWGHHLDDTGTLPSSLVLQAPPSLDSHHSFLLAPSSSVFVTCAHVRQVCHAESQQFFKAGDRHVSVLHSLQTASQQSLVKRVMRKKVAGLHIFTVTPYGVHARVPVIKLSASIAVAVLLCSVSTTGQQLGLLLTASPASSDPSRPLYYPCITTSENSSYRLVPLDTSRGQLFLFGKPASAKWRDIYLAHRPPPSPPARRIFLNRSLTTPFRIPRWTFHALARARHHLELLAPAGGDASPDWDGATPTTLVLSTSADLARARFGVLLGRCGGDRDRDAAPPPTFGGAPGGGQCQGDHQCAVDHVASWPDFARAFKFTVVDTDTAEKVVVEVELAFRASSLVQPLAALDKPSWSAGTENEREVHRRTFVTDISVRRGEAWVDPFPQ
ncbi:HET-domain-containing protein [Epithele typhae]|uniref:HET-domain-containing protein n=1 Tax=Epithele typhae TaxID=378194 RepID=UPI002007CC91|nr:HET-domain-containing protein [Epithele typhae]KAH9913131.1 HET-domain-containing protein [Epithele typhae]